MKKTSREKGYTLLELILVTAVLGGAVLLLAKLSSPMMKMFQRGRMRQQSQLDARTCLETIERLLSTAPASSLSISTTGATDPPNDRVQFQTVDNSSCTITWSNTPLNSVHLLQVRQGSTTASDTVLANHVTTLSFEWNDPSLLHVTLVMRVPLDASGTPDSFLTIQLPPQTIRLVGS